MDLYVTQRAINILFSIVKQEEEKSEKTQKNLTVSLKKVFGRFYE